MKSSANIPVDLDAYAERGYHQPDGIIVEEFHHCPRCDGRHLVLFFHPFSKPMNQFTHWTLCPTSKDPILLTVDPRKDSDG